MKSATTGKLSGCIVWVIVFAVLGSCFFPIVIFIGAFSSGSDLAMQTLGPALCPEGTTAEAYRYETTTIDEFGNPEPATATELHCVNEQGDVIKNDPVVYSFIWIGVMSLIGLVMAGGLALLLAAPAGVIIAKIADNLKKNKD